MKCKGKITMQFLKSTVALMFSLLLAGAYQVKASEISILTVEWTPHYGSELRTKARLAWCRINTQFRRYRE